MTVVKKKTAVVATTAVGKEVTSTCPYKVKITAESLSIRKGAGSNTAKVGSITDKGVYTIVEEKNGQGASLWGKLKSGAGWIALEHTKKI